VDHSWTASIAEGQRIYSALSQGLKSQDFNIGLSITATNGYGPIELNTSNGEYLAGDGHPITLNGQVYSTGLGVHANSEIHIHATNLQTPLCTRFQADIGVDDEVGNNGSVVFQVFADNVQVFDSGVMTGTSGTQHINVPIGHKSDLRLVVSDANDNSFYDHADWAGATLSCAKPVTAYQLPTISSVTGNYQNRNYTDQGITLSPTTVTMTGNNLQNATVTFGTFGEGTQVEVTPDGTQLSVIAPLARNLVPMVVATPLGKVNAGTFYDGYGEFRGQVHLLSLGVLPYGPAAGGAAVTLKFVGDPNFSGAPQEPFDVYDVYFGDKKSPFVSRSSDGTMIAIAPPGTGQVDVTARCPISSCYTLNAGITEALPYTYDR